MDFGFGLDGLMGSETPVITNGLASDPVTKNKLYGSTGLLRHERSGNSLFEDDWRSSKVSKSDGMLFQQRNSSLLRSNTTLFEGQQMLSFSTPLKSDSVFSDKPSEITTLPYFHLPNSALTRNSGMYTIFLLCRYCGQLFCFLFFFSGINFGKCYEFGGDVGGLETEFLFFDEKKIGLLLV